jgi:AmmeMemoRadiSam system protein B
MLSFAAIVPHPPIIIPTVGSPTDLGKVLKTIKAMNKLAEVFADSQPETAIIISPHALLAPSAFTINTSPDFLGRFFSFGDFSTELTFKNDLKLVSEIQKECENKKIPLNTIKLQELDHGTLVPLYYLSKKYPEIKIISLSFSFLDTKTHFNFGKLLQEIINQQKNKNIAVIASGDLSHRLTEDGPAGFSPQGEVFDKTIVKLLKIKDVSGILKMDPKLIEEAGECGYRSIVILLGVLDGLNWQPEILSYEGPFGVGYLVANFSLNT